MLRLSLPAIEIYNEQTEEFEILGGKTIELEHSLYTVAAWESKWKTPFADKKGLTREQLLDYIMNYMCQTPDLDKSDWLGISQEVVDKIELYMGDPQSATTIKNNLYGSGSSKREIVTAEVIYFYMAHFGIPFECEHWHLNRLMKLIDVCAIKNAPPKKMGRKEAAQMQAKQNAAMRARLGSKG